MKNIYDIEDLKSLIINYINIYINRVYPDLDNEILSDINSDLNGVSVSVCPSTIGNITRGNNVDGNIKVYTNSGFIDDNSFCMVFETLIHELCHTVSRNVFLEKIKFYEEGYVTYFSNKIIDFIVNNCIKVDGYDNDLLFKHFSNYSYRTGYKNETSVAIINDKIMNMYSIDTIYEYFFHSDGFERLVSSALKVSDDYSKFIFNQKFKGVNGTNFMYDNELSLLFDLLSKTDLNNVSSMDFSLSYLLKKYFLENYDVNNVTHKKIISYDSDFEKTFNSINDLKGISSNNFEVLVNEFNKYIDFNYDFDNSNFDCLNKQYDYLNYFIEQYNFSGCELSFYSVLFNLALNDNSDITQYSDYINLSYDVNMFNALNYLRGCNQKFIDKNSGKSNGDIISLALSIDVAFKVICSNYCTDNDFNKSTLNAIKLFNYVYDEYGLFCFNGLYDSLVIISKNYLSNGNSYDDLKILLDSIYGELNINSSLVECGYTVDSIILKSVDLAKMDNNEVNSFMSFINNKNLNLGKYVVSKSYSQFVFDLYNRFDYLTNDEKLVFVKNYVDCFDKGIFDCFKEFIVHYVDGNKMNMIDDNKCLKELEFKINDFLVYLYNSDRNMFLSLFDFNKYNKYLFSYDFRNSIFNSCFTDLDETEKEKFDSIYSKESSEFSNLYNVLDGADDNEKVEILHRKNKDNQYMYLYILNDKVKKYIDLFNSSNLNIKFGSLSSDLLCLYNTKSSGLFFVLVNHIFDFVNNSDLNFSILLNLLNGLVGVSSIADIEFLFNSIIDRLFDSIDELSELYIFLLDMVISNIDFRYKEQLMDIRNKISNNKTI